jgi:hypothetical protein
VTCLPGKIENRKLKLGGVPAFALRNELPAESTRRGEEQKLSGVESQEPTLINQGWGTLKHRVEGADWERRGIPGEHFG